MHVPDWDPALLVKFDAVDHVRTIADAGFQSYMMYATSLVGLCLWHTKIGQMHAAMKGGIGSARSCRNARGAAWVATT
jgi:hypothetical protein